MYSSTAQCKHRDVRGEQFITWRKGRKGDGGIKTRQRGWAIDEEECYSGICCVASNIYNIFREAIAGISVSGQTVQLPEEAVEKHGPVVKRAVDKVTDAIDGVAPK